VSTATIETEGGSVSPTAAKRSLFIVSVAVLLSSSTWFSGTAAAPQLIRVWGLSEAQSAWLTVSVQLGFITGTVLYSVLNLADVFNARRVFFVSACLGALLNTAFGFLTHGIGGASVFRFLTGVTLAGVYPVGMKLVASWFRSGLGWRLGVMVGALTLGTASPHLIQALGGSLDWRYLVAAASLSSLAGGLLVLTVLTDGPFLRQRARFAPAMLSRVFRNAAFRNTALSYFGHMWELYAFWSMVPFFLGARMVEAGSLRAGKLSLLAFLTIAAGGLGCAVGGWVSRSVGEKRVAAVSLLISGVMCLTSGLFYAMSPWLVVALLFVWGFFVVSDSPQFSALAARYCPPEYTGTALTVQNGVGFAVTVLSIQITPWIAAELGWQWAFTFLAAGPLAGLYFVTKLPTVDQPA
jgi:MFS family permease